MFSRAGLPAAAAALAIALLAVGPGHAQPGQRLPSLTPAPRDALTQALRAGRLSEARYSLERARALFGPAAVAHRYGRIRDTGGRSATLILRDLALRLGELGPTERGAAESLLARPDEGAADPGHQGYTTAAAPPFCTDHVCVHYVTTTADAPAAVDSDADGVPDQVELTASVVEEVWHKEVVEYGFRPPKSDETSPNHGPDQRIDVYLADLGAKGLYGYCASDDPVYLQAPAGGPYDVSAFCALDNDFSSSQFTGAASGTQALQVTVAHEFFHAIQFAYDVAEDTWLLEGTAVWMEDQVYDDINDNYQYLDASALKHPGVPLDLGVTDFSDALAGYQYGAFVFWRFLSESLATPEIVRRTWEFADGSAGAPDLYSIPAADAALREHGTNFRSAFTGFAVVNASPASFYEEGAAYPTPDVARAGRLSRAKPFMDGTAELDHLTSWYGVFRPTSGQRAKRVRLTLDLPPLGRGSQASVIIVQRSGARRVETVALDKRGDGNRVIPFDPSRVREIELVLTNASQRFHCWARTPLACRGIALDDALPFTYSLRLQ